MKITTELRRRDGSLPKIERPAVVCIDGHKKHSLETYLADESGIYDVPDEFGEQLVSSGNFSCVKAAQEHDSSSADAAPQNTDSGNVIVKEDGTAVDLDGMKKAELADFAAENFGIEFKQNDGKPAMIAAIMAAVQEAPAE